MTPRRCASEKTPDMFSAMISVIVDASSCGKLQAQGFSGSDPSMSGLPLAPTRSKFNRQDG